MLTKRLAACAALVTKGGVVCDVGTDHAYLTAELLQKGICTRAVATDIHQGPLDAARHTLSEADVLAQTELLLCDGLEQVQPEGITDVVIAGMGGETIVHILEQCSWKNEVNLILQPMTKIPTLRQWLAAQGFGWREHVIAEGEKFYVILDARYDGISRTLSVLEQEVGCPDWTEKTAQRYASWKRVRFQKLAQQLETAGQPDAQKWKAAAAQLEQMEHTWEEAKC